MHCVVRIACWVTYGDIADRDRVEEQLGSSALACCSMAGVGDIERDLKGGESAREIEVKRVRIGTEAVVRMTFE
jgi:hypothetical protein